MISVKSISMIKLVMFLLILANGMLRVLSPPYLPLKKNNIVRSRLARNQLIKIR